MTSYQNITTKVMSWVSKISKFLSGNNIQHFIRFYYFWVLSATQLLKSAKRKIKKKRQQRKNGQHGLRWINFRAK